MNKKNAHKMMRATLMDGGERYRKW